MFNGDVYVKFICRIGKIDRSTESAFNMIIKIDKKIMSSQLSPRKNDRLASYVSR